MKEFNLHDTLRVSDSTMKGFVVMQDQEGNTIFAKPNMIVENGREFIRDLVFKQVSGTAETRAFDYVKFGNSNVTTSPDDTRLFNVNDTLGVAFNGKVLITTSGSLTWGEVIEVYSSGLELPATAAVGELFALNNDDEEFDPAVPATYDLYTATGIDTWGSGVALTATLNLPTISGTPGAYTFTTRNNKLYYASRVLEILPPSMGTGLKMVIDIEGNASSDSATELGIFLTDGSLFSRVVFDAIPLAENFSYKLTYYIYF